MYFAEYLTAYIGNKKLAWKKAAELCGIERSLLVRYGKGEKLPRGEERVRQLAQGLGMDKEQSNKFLELYEAELLGHEQYEVNQYLQRRMAGGEVQTFKGALSPEWNRELPQLPNETSVCLESEDVIRGYLLRMIMSGQDTKLMITDSDLLLTLTPEIANGCGGKVQILTEINNQQRDWMKVRHLSQTIDFLLNWEEAYLDCITVSASLEKRDAIQLCITSEGVLLFESDMSRGFYSREETQLQFYSSIFQKQQEKSERIGQNSQLESELEEPVCRTANEFYEYQLLRNPEDKDREWIRLVDKGRNKAFVVEHLMVIYWIGMFIKSS